MRSHQRFMLPLAGCVGLIAGTPNGNIEQEFEAFIQKFGKTYEDESERQVHFEAFKDNFMHVESENAKGNRFKLAMNSFADQSAHEFRSGRLGLSGSSKAKLLGATGPHLGTHVYSGAALPSSVDWVDRGAVTPVKNQGGCGSCWAFSATGALEGAWRLATGDLVAMSEQQLVSCDSEANGCDGGAMDDAFTFLLTHGLCSEEGYPYVEKKGECAPSACDPVLAKGAVTGFKDLPIDDENALMEAAAQQPVSVAIEADQASFKMYSSGILTGECGAGIDHGVLLVGYGTEDGVDYWKVKNSWGNDWGEGGFVRMERGKVKEGQCGITAMSSYPVVSSSVAQSDEPGPESGEEDKAKPEQPEPASEEKEDEHRRAFDIFADKYERKYESSADREAHFELFKASLILVENENAKGLAYTLEINQFADQSNDEFKGQRLGMSSPSLLKEKLWKSTPYLGQDVYSGGDLPSAVDWTEQGAITPVKNQGNCGACWTFASTGALEGVWHGITGKLESMSEQQLVDCVTDGIVGGCGGGDMDSAFSYLESHPVCSAESYPYMEKSSLCKEEGCSEVIAKGGVVGFRDVAVKDEKALLEAVAKRPVSTAVQGGQRIFRAYSGGVLTRDCSADVDHAVLIVGFGTDDGVDYWKIKNSWGSSWGEDGYIRLKRGVAGEGECGVYVMPSYPVLHTPEVIQV